MSDYRVAIKTAGFRGKSIAKGQVFCAEHPLVKDNPHLFAPLSVEHHCGRSDVVEDATAEPGQKRRVGRPPKPRDEEGNIIREEPAGDGAG